MIGDKDGQLWWHKYDDKGNLIPVTEEEAAENKKRLQDIFDKKASKVLSDFFTDKHTNHDQST
jgi:hypothetical protein